ncbi:MAG: DUF2723 domain-containing protein [Ardenticatenales bacterium]|nr:DUF2723 domain-containing protein [Ardenticatenales bacterium]
MPTRRPSPESLIALTIALASLVLYGLTLAPGVVTLFDDSLEFQLIAQRAGIPHPTGYPLYAILLALSARLLPVGEVAFRANLLSALAASGAVALTFLMGRALGLARLPALVPPLLVALSPTFWAQATVAEVYALHILLMAAMLWAVITHRLRLAALFFGLGLAHHRMIVLWLPALAGYALLYRRGALPLRLPVDLLRLAGIALLPLLLYGWLPLRASVGSLDGTYQEVGFGCWVRACQYSSAFFQDNALASARPLSFYGALLLEEVGWLGMLLAGAGMVRLWRDSLEKGVLLGVGLLVNAGFALAYRVPDPEVFWLPAIWVLALLAGWGVQGAVGAVGALERWSGGAVDAMSKKRCAHYLLFALALLPLLWRGVMHFPAADRSHILGPPEMNGSDVLAQPLPENSLVIGLQGEISYLAYLQETQNLNPAVELLALPADPATLRLDAIKEALAAGKRPFLTRELAGAGEAWSLSALGPLIEVQREPQASVPDGLWPLGLPLGDVVTLAAWTRSPIARSEMERVTLAWRVEAPITENLQVSARLLGSDGTVLSQRDTPPLSNAYPTTLWRPGEVILDTYTLPSPPEGARYFFVLYRIGDGSEVGRAEWGP